MSRPVPSSTSAARFAHGLGRARFRSRRGARGRFLWLSRRGWRRPKARADPGHSRLVAVTQLLKSVSAPHRHGRVRGAVGMGARRVVGRPRGLRQLIGRVGFRERLGDAHPEFRVVPGFRDARAQHRAACWIANSDGSSWRSTSWRSIADVRLLPRNTGRRPGRLSVRPFSSPSDPVSRIAKPACPVHSRRIAAMEYVRSTLPPTQSTRATPRSVRARDRAYVGSCGEWDVSRGGTSAGSVLGVDDDGGVAADADECVSGHRVIADLEAGDLSSVGVDLEVDEVA